MSVDGLVDSATAAGLLGVSARRVSQLADAGDITRATRGLYDRLSIERYLATRRATRGRAWDIGTAWAAVAILSDHRRAVAWLSERSTYRLEATLRTITAAELVGKARDRARVHVLAGHPSAVAAVRSEVVWRDWSSVGLAGVSGDGSDGVDGYVDSAALGSIVERRALVASTSGTITLRATDADLEIVRALNEASDVLVALDAAGSIDARAGGTGERALDRALVRLAEQRGWSR